jgi:3',5'-cyclic AMP phosphodiesterase CpdA
LRRVLHLSDVHFGPKHLPEVSAGLLAWAAAQKPDFVVVSGDLTQRAKPSQFRQARAWIDRLPQPALCVPGNHDVPLYRFWERLLRPFGAYGRHFDGRLEPDLGDPEVFLAGLNTATNWTLKNGRVTTRQIEALEKRLNGAPAGAARIVVAHHPLVPGPGFGDHMVVAGGEALAAVLTRCRVDLVLSGHLHYGYLASSDQGYRSDAVVRYPTWLLHTGTATSSRGRFNERRRNTFHWIEVRERALELRHLEWERGEARELVRHEIPRRS